MNELIIPSFIFLFLLLLISYLMYGYAKNKIADCKVENLELNDIKETLEARVVQRTQELKETTEKLEALSTTDSLTNTHNRYSIMKILDLEVDRAKRYNNPLTVFMYDIDHFKRVNDRHGYGIGDDVLCDLTKVVKQSLRDIDIVGRYVGEVFLVIMPSTSLSDAIAVAQRVCSDVSNYKFQEVGEITISIGLSELQSDESMDMLFMRVDKLLYKSKESGRNRVSF